MGELAEALRRANDDADRVARAERASGGSADPVARTLSLDEVLGRSRERARNSEAPEADGPQEPAIAAPPAPGRSAAARPDEPSRAPSKPVVQTLSRADETGYRAQRIAIVDESTPGGAAARRLAQKVKRSAGARGIRSIVVTSSLRGEGKTTTACNLAIALSRLDRSESVVLVDLDLRRPSIARSLGVAPVRSVNDVLERRATLDEALVATDVPGLFILATTRGTAKPESLLASHKLRDLIQALERRFSRVVIDTPPALVVADASGVIEAAGGYLFVASSGNSPTKSIKGALEHLPREKMLGCVLNFAREARTLPTEYYYSEKNPRPDATDAPSVPEGEVAR